MEAAIADLKKALEGTDTEAIRTASEKAAQVSQKMGQAIYAQAQAANAPGPDAAPTAPTAGHGRDDDVVDAEIVDEGKPADEEGGAA